MKNRFQEIDEKNPRELLKEVLRRANKKEKQEYTAISDRQTAINQRLEAIVSEEEELEEKDEMNQFPESKSTHSSPSKTSEEIMRMSSGELHEWCEQTCRGADESIAESKTVERRICAMEQQAQCEPFAENGLDKGIDNSFNRVLVS